MFREAFGGIPKEKSPEQFDQEEKMREDSQNQFRLAITLYSRFHGMRDSDDDDFGNSVIIFWTEKDENGQSYSKRYRDFVDSDEFKNNPKFQGNIKFIELDDFI
jgi:hypothetical protein